MPCTHVMRCAQTGGTYFPPEDKFGRPGFTTVLKRVSEAWGSQRGQLQEQGKHILNALNEAINPGGDALSMLHWPKMAE